MRTSEVISRRRALSLLGLAGLTIAVPSALVLTVSEAEAQASPPLAPPEQDPKAGPQTGGGSQRRMSFSEKSATFRKFAAPVAANLSGIAAGSYCCREDDFDQ